MTDKIDPTKPAELHAAPGAKLLDVTHPLTGSSHDITDTRTPVRTTGPQSFEMAPLTFNPRTNTTAVSIAMPRTAVVKACEVSQGTWQDLAADAVLKSPLCGADVGRSITTEGRTIGNDGASIATGPGNVATSPTTPTQSAPTTFSHALNG